MMCIVGALVLGLVGNFAALLVRNKTIRILIAVPCMTAMAVLLFLHLS